MGGGGTNVVTVVEIGAAIVGFFGWLFFALLVVDPLCRKLIHATMGIELARGRGPSNTLTWDSATPNRGGCLSVLYTWFVYALCFAPLPVGIGAMLLVSMLRQPR